ncbi:hypothetical protein EYY48_14815 [Enterococcus faecalis]|uniref:hypothetical protein n=1 Tax=Enterococcus TaxID=1350 RepID=UPI00070BEA18|nr:hypothetical protein [Enterococcus faecalis]KXF69574.1 hypothetical protein AQ486_13455 [Enterococcus faecalis]MBC2813562.1 hypothetical protein [Enterococcus faecalis]MBC2818475.1 hypothetical protein [Enterococcus faecalis]MBC2833745.1 hypothetical protein [Enterococcus faecalis]MBC2849567.1 hypothetical protein [Enterococcus faecalis]
MSKQELVDKNEVLSIWHNYWESDKLAYEAEDELRELKTIICITELNENQQTVLDWLKTLPLFPISAVYLLEAGKNVPKNVKNSYENFDKKEETEVLQSFCQWVIEQEEK